MAAEVQVIISATDKTKGAFGSAEKGAHGLGGALAKVGKIAAVAGAAAVAAIGVGLVVAIKKGVSAASDLSESMNKVSVVFGDWAEDIIHFSDNAANGLGMSRQAALEAAGTFGNLFDSMGIGKEATVDMTEGILTLAADLASFNNLDPTVALEKLRAGLVGEVEPLRSLGVNLSAAAVELKAVELGLVASGDELSASAKAQASYALILEQTTNAQGDFARTSDGLANSQRIVQAQIADVTATFGQAFLPIIEQVTGVIVKDVMPAFSKFAAAAGPKIAEAMSQAIDWTMNKLIPALKDLWTWISANIIPVLMIAYDWLKDNIPLAMKAISDFWDSTLLPAFTALYNWLAANLPGAIQVLSDFWTGTLQPALSAVWSFIQDNVIPIFEIIASKLNAEMPGAIKTLVEWWNGTLKPALVALWEFLTVDMKPIWEALNELIGVTLVLAFEAVKLAWNAVLKPAFDAIWKLIQDYVLPAFESISKNETLLGWIDAIAGAISTLVGWLKTAVTWFQNLGKAKANSDEKGTTTPGAPGSPRQFGGPVAGGGSYLVGERGPELFVPYRSGTIINNFNLTANYQDRDRQSLAMDIKMLAAMYG